MKRYIKNLELFLESNKPKPNTSLITDICVSMLLINPNFLDQILDRGNRTRYLHNNNVFLNDLKNLVLGKNRLKLGIRQDKKYVEEENLGKINSYFNEHSQDFNMEDDYSKLVKARDIARNIQDKLINNQKLEPSMVRSVFWIAPNKDRFVKEDIVLETTDGRQYPLVINSKLNLTKTQSFNTFLDLMLDQQSDNLFTDEYLGRWDKLTQQWFNLIYRNVKNEYKLMIDEFIDASRGDSLTYFDFFDITIKDPEYKILGKYFPRLGKNYKELSKLLSDIWKEKVAFDNFEETEKEWNELKKIILNSKIIEHIIINSLSNLIDGEVEKTEEGYVIAEDKVKMRLLRVLVNLMNVEDIDVYYCGKTDFYHIPSRKWFRENYDRLHVEYDYHQKLMEDNDSQFRIKVELDNRPLMEMELFTGFSGGEMSGKLNTKMKVKYESDFNYKISNVNGSEEI
jgi:hypothetical protein